MAAAPTSADRGAPDTLRIALGDRSEAMTESDFIQRCSEYGVRCFIAGADWYFTIGPKSKRGVHGGAREVAPEQLARVIYHEQVVDGEPLKLPYASLADPSRISFRYTERGKSWTEGRRRVKPRANVRRRRVGPHAQD